MEPPEDQDVVDYKDDPVLWKSGSKRRMAKLTFTPEEDLDDLHHPSVADLKRQVGNEYAFSLDEYPEGAVNVFKMKNSQEPEEDVDDVAHGRYDQAGEKMAVLLTDVLLSLHRSEKDVSPDLQPEEDMDKLFHDNNPQAVPYLRHGEPVDSQEDYDYSQPEVDLDYLFHK